MDRIENDIFYEKFRKGDPQTISQLFDAYYSICIYSAMQLLACKEDAEDAVSGAFVDLWETRRKFDGKRCKLKTWLLMIARRRAIDILRKRHNNIPLDDEHIILIASNTYTDLEQREILLNIIQSLSDGEKDLFYRKYFYFQSYEEIAVQTGKTVDSVKSSLYRIRMGIKMKFESEGAFYG